MLFRLRILVLLAGVVLFLPLFTVPIFLLHVILIVLGLLMLWLAFAAHKNAALLLRTYKELKESATAEDVPAKQANKNRYV